MTSDYTSSRVAYLNSLQPQAKVVTSLMKWISRRIDVLWENESQC